MTTDAADNTLGLERLRAAILADTARLRGYEKPAETLTYEVVRVLDSLFCEDLFGSSGPSGESDFIFKKLSTWGINHALRRVLPRMPAPGPFRDFRSTPDYHEQASEFVFRCGILAQAERLESALRQGVLSAELRPYPVSADDIGMTDILILRSQNTTFADEDIGRAGLNWASNIAWAKDRGIEKKLEQRHRKLEPLLHRHVRLVDGWRMEMAPNLDIDLYFLDWARLYLRRIYSQDMIGADDLLGGRPFSSYVEVLAALSAMSQKRLAYTAILRARNPSVEIRNLLTSYVEREVLIGDLANITGMQASEIAEILPCLTLSGENLDVHTSGGDPAWPPLIKASEDFCILPTFGLEINPFLFLLADLRSRFKDDWFKIANNREGRWIEEFDLLFQEPRWKTHTKNLDLKDQGKVLTDLDFVALDVKTNELAIFQLKWQFPVSVDSRSRRSTGKNLLDESNKWVERVTGWLDKYGTIELARRLGFEVTEAPAAQLFVLGRYHAHLAGYDARDSRALWSDWAHFKRARTENPKKSPSQLARELRSAIVRSKGRNKPESTMIPVGTVSVLLNPTQVPDLIDPE